VFLDYEQVVADGTVDDIDDLSPPTNATGAEIQSDTNPVRYTMDGTNPTQTSGMIFLAAHQPKFFSMADIRAIQYTRGAGVNGNLNIHYFAGRNV
jgi:hypothetical protein